MKYTFRPSLGMTSPLTGLVHDCYLRRQSTPRGKAWSGSSREAATGRRLIRWSVRASVVALLVVALPGCVKHSVIPDEPDTITIRVSNNNSLDINVYAVNQSMRIRLGTVTTASTQRFELSLHQISPTGELQLLADPVGSRRTMRSEAIHVSAGQVVEWTLQADLRQSSLTIRS